MIESGSPHSCDASTQTTLTQYDGYTGVQPTEPAEYSTKDNQDRVTRVSSVTNDPLVSTAGIDEENQFTSTIWNNSEDTTIPSSKRPDVNMTTKTIKTDNADEQSVIKVATLSFVGVTLILLLIIIIARLVYWRFPFKSNT